MVAADAGLGGGGEDKEDRLVAALLLRDARTKSEFAQEEGIGALLSGPGAAPTINARILKGEISQARSHNRRCGVEPLPALAPSAPSADRPGSKVQASVLEREFLRSAHQMREGACSSSAASPSSAAASSGPRKRQRVGADGAAVDLAAAQEAADLQADEDEALANPLLRPPPPDPARAAKKAAAAAAAIAAAAAAAVSLEGGKGRGRGEEEVLWPTKGMRVRIVDAEGRFSFSHLKKGVVCKRSSATRCVDVEIEGSKKVLRDVPQKLLETVVSKACERVEVVHGPHTGLTAPLLRRNSKLGIAVIGVVRAGGESGELELPLDDVCEFA